MFPKSKPARLKGKAMQALRQECLNRDRGRCQECGILVDDSLPDWHPRKYHMAHIRSKHIGGDVLENVRVLCGKDHSAEHHGRIQRPARESC
jgi:5-methylcytosine-specific restriction endonuclease McrA